LTFENPEAKAFFTKHGTGMWKWKLEEKQFNFCGSGSTLKKEAGSGSKRK